MLVEHRAAEAHIGETVESRPEPNESQVRIAKALHGQYANFVYGAGSDEHESFIDVVAPWVAYEGMSQTSDAEMITGAINRAANALWDIRHYLRDAQKADKSTLQRLKFDDDMRTFMDRVRPGPFARARRRIRRWLFS